MVDAEKIAGIVENELRRMNDINSEMRIRGLLVRPHRVDRDWDYGKAGEKYPCWTVLQHPDSNTGVAYCEHGFGPERPWGLVFLSGPHMNMGQDSAWFKSLEQAAKESFAGTDG